MKHLSRIFESNDPEIDKKYVRDVFSDIYDILDIEITVSLCAIVDKKGVEFGPNGTQRNVIPIFEMEEFWSYYGMGYQIFIDINMEDVTGIDGLKKINRLNKFVEEGADRMAAHGFEFYYRIIDVNPIIFLRIINPTEYDRTNLIREELGVALENIGMAKILSVDRKYKDTYFNLSIDQDVVDAEDCFINILKRSGRSDDFDWDSVNLKGSNEISVKNLKMDQIKF